MTVKLKPASVLPGLAGTEYDSPEWCISPGGRHRDSDYVERANHRVMRYRMEEVDPDQNHHQTLTMRHWAVGWVNEIIFRKGSACEKVALDAAEALENYPILDEHLASEEEMEDESSTYKEDNS